MIAGDRDVEEGAVSFRYRNGDQDNGVSVEDAIARVVEDAVQRGSRSEVPAWSRCRGRTVSASRTTSNGSEHGARLAYIKGENKPSDASSGECPFLRVATLEDREGLVGRHGEVAYASS